MVEAAPSSLGKLNCVVVTPEATILDETARFVAVPLFDGEIGIAPGHSPLIGRLGYGEMRIVKSDGTQKTYFVDGGFVQVAHGTVTVLTGRAVPAAELDEKKSREELSEARAKPAHTPELMAIRDRDIARARARVRLAGRG